MEKESGGEKNPPRPLAMPSLPALLHTRLMLTHNDSSGTALLLPLGHRGGRPGDGRLEQTGAGIQEREHLRQVVLPEAFAEPRHAGRDPVPLAADRQLVVGRGAAGLTLLLLLDLG